MCGNIVYRNKVLVETHQELQESRIRQTYSLLACKLRADETWAAGLSRGAAEKLKVTRASECVFYNDYDAILYYNVIPL